MDALRRASDNFRYERHLSDAAICPASWCSFERCGPVWEFADRIQNISTCLKALCTSLVFRSRLTDFCAIPSFDHLPSSDDLWRMTA